MTAKTEQKSYKLRVKMREVAETGAEYEDAVAGLMAWAVDEGGIPKTLVKKYCDRNQWDKAMREGTVAKKED